MVFPGVMYGCEKWIIKKAEGRRIDAFELSCWRRLLRFPWTARRFNQSILKISPGISLERMMLKLKLQYFGHLMPKTDLLEKTLMMGRIDIKAETSILWPPDVKNWLIGKDPNAGKDWRQEEKGTTEDEMAGWHHWLDGHESEWTLGVGHGQAGLACCLLWGCKESDTTERLNWENVLFHYFRNNVAACIKIPGILPL